jgi:hypothetical protein
MFEYLKESVFVSFLDLGFAFEFSRPGDPQEGQYLIRAKISASRKLVKRVRRGATRDSETHRSC